jgi:hypothetical protein
MFFLGKWYQTLNPTWIKVNGIETIADHKFLGPMAHHEVAQHHWHLLTAERKWRSDLSVSLGGDAKDTTELPEALDKAGKKSMAGVLALAWKLSVEREEAHYKAAKWHLALKQRKAA